MNNEIKKEIAQVKAAYCKGQRERAQAGLSAQRRKELLDIQNARIERISYLESLLVQRFKFN